MRKELPSPGDADLLQLRPGLPARRGLRLGAQGGASVVSVAAFGL